MSDSGIIEREKRMMTMREESMERMGEERERCERNDSKVYLS